MLKYSVKANSSQGFCVSMSGAPVPEIKGFSLRCHNCRTSFCGRAVNIRKGRAAPERKVDRFSPVAFAD